MARPVDEKNREKMQESIMETAREVFCEKGYSAVTMSDLIEAAGMSRGGFYFYYKSVDEVFREAVRHRKKSLFAELRRSIEHGPDFHELLDDYFSKQKMRLLNMGGSMLRALYEYLFTQDDAEFRNEQKNNIMDTVNAILQLGVRQGAIRHEHIDLIAEHFMYTIEGLNVMAMFQGLAEETIDQQFDILKNMLT